MWMARRVGGRPIESIAQHASEGERRSRLCAPAPVPCRKTVHACRSADGRQRILGLIPAHNEAANLAAVVDELRACRPDIDILVVDDGSTDETAALLERLDVRWLRFPSAWASAARCAPAFDMPRAWATTSFVRMDGDGQHRADDIERLLGAGRSEDRLTSCWVRGTRDPRRATDESSRLAQRLLAACLSALTGSA